MSVYGYIRIITGEQNKERQQEALKEYAVKNNVKYTTVFEDKASEKSFERPQYKALQRVIRFGDVVIIKGLDRLGRNNKEIQQEIQEFKSKGINLLILNIPMLQKIQGQDMIMNLIDYVA